MSFKQVGQSRQPAGGPPFSFDARSSMPVPIPTNECRLLIFEGIMGSGKSTATVGFGKKLAAEGLKVAAYTEAANPHPVRASDDLPDFFQPWLHISAPELAARTREKWGCYVEDRRRDKVSTVMDGQLFHGDLTNLFIMDMTPSDIADHMGAMLQILAPLQPMVVYFRQSNLPHAIHTVLEVRGTVWRNYQLGWKLRSPYAVRRQLVGVEGFTSMYIDYRTLTDSLLEAFDCPKLCIETGGDSWAAHYKEIDTQLAGLHAPF